MLKEKHFNKKKEGEFYIQVLAENLKNIRDHFDIFQEELAEAAQISVNEVSKIERKIINPGLATLVALAKGLELDIGTLLTPDLDVSKLNPP